MSGRPQETATLRQIGQLRLDGAAARIEWRGHRVDLTLSEFRVVQLLVDRAGQDASYRDIYDTVKGIGFIAGTGTDGYRANVRAMVKRIRQKFKEADKHFTAIHNYPGFGYRWISEA
jgi:two-component system response regulator ChvI